MENLKLIQSLETALKSMLSLTGTLAAIAKFLFLTPFGWILLFIALVFIVIYKSKNKKGEITIGGLVSGLSETLFWFYSHLTSVIIGLVVLFSILYIYNSVKDFSKTLALYREVKTLEATLKNLKTERKLLEVTASAVPNSDTPKLTIKIKYFTYSPVKDMDIISGEKNYTIAGKKLYLDFGLINFDYSLIEKGSAKNIAIPNKIYSETVTPENGVNINAMDDGTPLTFKLDNQNLYVIDQNDFKGEIAKILETLTDDSKARKMGVRTSYSEAVSFVPNPNRAYNLFSTAAGGIVLR